MGTLYRDKFAKWIIRRDAGVVELDSLENCCGASHRGFESHSLRFLVFAR